MKYQEAKNKDLAQTYKNDPTDFAVGDTIATDKEGAGMIEGEIIAINGQQLTCQWEYGIFFAWSWQSKKL